MITAAAYCPRVHTGLNLVVIGLLLVMIGVILLALGWSVYSHRYPPRANPDVSAGDGQRGSRGSREADATGCRTAAGRKRW